MSFFVCSDALGRDTADDELFPTLGRRVAEDERTVLEQLSIKQLCEPISSAARSTSVLCAHLCRVRRSLTMCAPQPQKGTRGWDQRRGDGGGKGRRRRGRAEGRLRRAAARRMRRARLHPHACCMVAKWWRRGTPDHAAHATTAGDCPRSGWALPAMTASATRRADVRRCPTAPEGPRSVFAPHAKGLRVCADVRACRSKCTRDKTFAKRLPSSPSGPTPRASP
jgi:hypothetical protein